MQVYHGNMEQLQPARQGYTGPLQLSAALRLYVMCLIRHPQHTLLPCCHTILLPGPRGLSWRDDKPAELSWIEAQASDPCCSPPASCSCTYGPALHA